VSDSSRSAHRSAFLNWAERGVAIQLRMGLLFVEADATMSPARLLPAPIQGFWRRGPVAFDGIQLLQPGGHGVAARG
jgi:hypothetical protein